jgi:DeoR family transcriptional regulator of aga operon
MAEDPMPAQSASSVWLQVERRLKVLELLREQRTLKSAEMADRFGVNIATIRRDFQALAGEYGVRPIHGGATMITVGGGLVLDEIDLETKQVTNLDAKRTIARKAAALIADGDTIALNAGSTVELVLDYLGPTIRSISVLTLGLNIAWRAARMPAVSLYLAGGHYRRASQALVGTAAANALRGVHVDKAFMGANAVDPEAGWTHPSDSEVETNQLLLRNARRSYLLADSSKFGRVAFSQVSPLTEFDAFIVDDEFATTYREWAEAQGIEVI